MFVTAVCVLFLIKLRWPKKKNFYDPEYKILEGQNIEFKILGGQNPELKILEAKIFK